MALLIVLSILFAIVLISLIFLFVSEMNKRDRGGKYSK